MRLFKLHLGKEVPIYAFCGTLADKVNLMKCSMDLVARSKHAPRTSPSISDEMVPSAKPWMALPSGCICRLALCYNYVVKVINKLTDIHQPRTKHLLPLKIYERTLINHSIPGNIAVFTYIGDNGP